jgi:mRNA interferase MazF
MQVGPLRGEIYLVNWNPGRGSEQSGKRPALVIQNDTGNRFSPTTIVAACSTAMIKPYPFIVRLSAKESGLGKDGYVNLAQVMTVDNGRLETRLGALTEKKMDEVDEAIHSSLGLKGK